MADINKIKKINSKDIVVDWDNINNKPDDLAKTSDVEEQIEQIKNEIPSIEGLASEEYVDDRFEELTGAAPEALDTLEELAKALGEDVNFSATIIDELGKKQNQLTFDEAPTEGSINPVTSGGLFNILSSKADCTIIDGSEIDNLTFGLYKYNKITRPSITQFLNNYVYIFAYNSGGFTTSYMQLKITDTGIQIRTKYVNIWNSENFADIEWSTWESYLTTSNVIDSLDSALINAPLSAKQGKILNDTKVNKVDGKDLSTNDFTDELKSKLENIDENATEYVHPETHPADMITGLADVAQSGSYNDLTDTPEIPVVDTQLDETSSNAISNSVVATKFNEDIGDINSALEEIITLQEELLIPDGNEVAY